MIKKILTTGILFLILATSVAPVGVGAQQAGLTAAIAGPTANALVETGAQFIGSALQRISSIFLLISGLLFDKVIDVTVTKMSTNLGTGSAIGNSIQEAWGTLRDIANMVFIFVLLYTAFNYMFSVGAGNVGRNIAWIVIIALIINFSLFFSKVVIDASNVISLGFQRAISSAGSYTLNNANTPGQPVPQGTPGSFSGISGGYMRMLGIHSFWGPTTANISGGVEILTIGILSAIFVLIASVILLIMSVMFAARFVILIFVMILSPIAFVAYIIPGMNGRFNEWWNALINQSFFAPVFFGLTWVVFKIGSKANFLNSTEGSGANWVDIVSTPGAVMGLVINYVIVIGFSIFALTASKKMASSLSQFASVSGVIGGAVGGATLGTAGAFGRQTLGRLGTRVAQSSTLRDTAARGGVSGFIAKQTLKTGAAAGGATYDARGSKLLDKLTQGTIKDLGKPRESAKGGYMKSLEATDAKEFSKKFMGATPQERIRQSELETKKSDMDKEYKATEAGIKDRASEIERLKSEVASRPFSEQAELNKKISELEKEQEAPRERMAEINKTRVPMDTEISRLKDIGGERDKAFADSEEKKNVISKILGTNKRIALALRENSKKQKGDKEKVDKLLKVMGGEEEEKKTSTEEGGEKSEEKAPEEK